MRAGHPGVRQPRQLFRRAGLALGLGLLVVTGLVRLWHVYIFAFLLGCAAAFDAPARQTFVAELVEERDLPNAVGLNST